MLSPELGGGHAAARFHHPSRRYGGRVAARGGWATARAPGRRVDEWPRIGFGDSGAYRGVQKGNALIGLPPDVILPNAPPSVMALLTVNRTVPIVFAAATDPVGLGIVQTL